MLVVVDVAVALARPPREDRWSRVIVEASDEAEALRVALQMAHRADVVMPTRGTVVDILEI